MEQAAVEVPRVEKKSKRRMVGILVALVLILSAGAAGAVFSPRLLAKFHPVSKPAAAAEGEGEGEAQEQAEDGTEKAKEGATEAPPEGSASKRHKGPVGEILELPATIVDIRASDNSLRHIKVQLAIEIQKGKNPEEFKRLVPFAKEAAITYLRTQEFDRLSDPKSFELVRKEIEAQVIDSIGKDLAKRVLIVDFVVQ